MRRQGFIGGSDATTIMQFKWYDLWLVKTGRAEAEDLSDNIAVQLGSHTENFNIKWFEKSTGCFVTKQQKQFKKTIGDVPLVGGSGGKVLNTSSIIEAKHTNPFNTMDDMIERYMPQIQLYCHVSGAEGCHLSVIFGNSKWQSAFVHYDEEYFNKMMVFINDFWWHVVNDKEPVGIDTPEDISINHIPVDNMVVRDASTDNAFVDASITYINGLEQNKVFENAKKDLKNMVGSNEREVFCDYLTIKRDKRGSLRISKRSKKDE
jgi:predicted phage-related endonuclease